jgi:hypothetical protein
VKVERPQLAPKAAQGVGVEPVEVVVVAAGALASIWDAEEEAEVEAALRSRLMEGR